MRKLSMIVVVICGASPSVRAESLMLNSAQYSDSTTSSRTYSTAPTVAPLPTYTTATVIAADSGWAESTATVPTASAQPPVMDPQVGHIHGGCQCGGCQQHGSLGVYPGGCCRESSEAACCAALWADYCAHKKPCWRPHSPRRHSSPGFAIPTLGLCDAFTSLHRPAAPCDHEAPCDCESSTLAVPQGEDAKDGSSEALDGEMPSPSDLPPEAILGDEPETLQPVPPAPTGAMNRKFGFPFSWKLPSRTKSNPFSTFGGTARHRLPKAR